MSLFLSGTRGTCIASDRQQHALLTRRVLHPPASTLTTEVSSSDAALMFPFLFFRGQQSPQLESAWESVGDDRRPLVTCDDRQPLVRLCSPQRNIERRPPARPVICVICSVICVIRASSARSSACMPAVVCRCVSFRLCWKKILQLNQFNLPSPRESEVETFALRLATGFTHNPFHSTSDTHDAAAAR